MNEDRRTLRPRMAAPQRKLPQGDLTFLLTDIEGSTDLLDRLDDRYAALLSDVRRRVGAAVRKACGHQVSARGDDVFAVFERAPEACRARWPSSGPCPPVAGPTTPTPDSASASTAGAPRSTETGYVGLSVHAAARICFAGHGGQIVMSSAVRTAVLDPPPHGYTLRAWAPGGFAASPRRWPCPRWRPRTCSTDFPPLRSAVAAD